MNEDLGSDEIQPPAITVTLTLEGTVKLDLLRTLSWPAHSPTFSSRDTHVGVGSKRTAREDCHGGVGSGDRGRPHNGALIVVHGAEVGLYRAKVGQLHSHRSKSV